MAKILIGNLWGVTSFPRKLKTSPRVLVYLDNQNTALLQTSDLTVHDLDGFFNEVEFVVNLDFIQRYSKSLDTALNLNDLLSCLVDDLWASELTISDFSPADRDFQKYEVNFPSRSEMIETGTLCLETTSFKYCLVNFYNVLSSLIASLGLGTSYPIQDGWNTLTYETHA
ncbi:hypothetical protein Tco_0885092 [Tanacetum coccineum]